MLGTIVLREMQEYIKSMKFQIGIAVTVLLAAATTVVNLNDYIVRHQDYLDARRTMGVDHVFRPPQVLSILVAGKDAKLGHQAKISPTGIPAEANGYLGEYRSFHERLMARIAPVDFAFVVRVMMSLLVIFLTFSAVSEEKTSGTLALVMANSVPRGTLLLGKAIGGFAVVMSALLIAAGVALLIMGLHPAIILTSSDWIRIGGILAASALYLWFFQALGLAVSAVVNRPTVALAVLIQAWILLIIIYPNVGIFIADRSHRLPTELEIGLRENEVERPYLKEGNRLLDEFTAKNPGKNSQLSGSDPLLKRREADYNKAAEVGYQLKRDYSRQMMHQAEYARKLTMLSPAALLDQTLQRFAKTGVEEYERFLDGIYINWNTYRRYMENDTVYREKLKHIPEFTYPSETTAGCFRASLPSFLLLFLMTALGGSIAHVLFLRKDVRS